MRRAMRFGAMLGLLVMALGFVPAAGAQQADYAVSGGRFYSQTGGGGGNGFSVVDGGWDINGQEIRFWSEFQRLGGVTTLGYPASRRFQGPGGFTYQLFQRGALQWRPERRGALLSNIFEWFQENNQDAFLAAQGIPAAIRDDGSSGNYQLAVQIRTGWMTNDAIRRHFLSSPNAAAIRNWTQDAAIELYGLPMSRPERAGPFIVQRFQRIAFQLWVDSVPGMPAPGSVVGILGGDLLKQAGIVAGTATLPEGPGGTSPTTAAPAAPPAATPTPVSSHAWRIEGPNVYPNCGTTWVWGKVKDATGAGVDGISVRSWNDWGNEVISGSGQPGRETGYWDRIMGPGVRAGTWYAAVVDGNGVISSPVAVFTFTGDCGAGGIQSVELNWVRR